jgi:hypothetical protein
MTTIGIALSQASTPRVMATYPMIKKPPTRHRYEATPINRIAMMTAARMADGFRNAAHQRTSQDVRAAGHHPLEDDGCQYRASLAIRALIGSKLRTAARVLTLRPTSDGARSGARWRRCGPVARWMMVSSG